MKREGKPGPFIPSEVPAQTGLARVTTSAPRAGVVGRPEPSAPGQSDLAWATTCTPGRRRTRAPGRQHLRPCNNGCRTGGVFFHQHPKLQRSGDDIRMRAGDNVCARLTTSTPVRQQVPCGRGVFSQTP